MPRNYVKKAFRTKQAPPINSNDCTSTANNLHTSINKETASEKLAIDAQAFLTTLSPNPTPLASDKLEESIHDTYLMF